MFSHLRLHEWYERHHLPKEKQFFVFVDENAKEVERLSFIQLDKYACSVALQLMNKSRNETKNTPSLSPGDTVVLMCPPSLEFMKLFLGCLYAGLIVVPVSPPAVPLFRRNSNKNSDNPSAAMEAAWGSLDNIIKDSGAKIGLTTNSLLSILQTVKYDPNFSAERYNGLATLQWETVDTANALQTDFSENLLRFQPTDDTIAMIQYSSGSTGKPKGVILSHNNIFQNCQMMFKFVGSTAEEVSVSWLPMYHDMGLMGHFFSPLIACPKLQVITRATVSGGPNFAYSLLSNRYRYNAEESLKHLDLSCWRVAYCGAEPVRPSTLHSFIQVFKGCKFNPKAFFPVYGMAEAVLLLSYRHNLDESEASDISKDARVLKISRSHLAKKNVKVIEECGLGDFRFGAENAKDHVSVISLGRPPKNTNMLIVDPKNRTVCPEGHVGEIWVSNPCVSVGYWRKPEMSSHAFHGFTADNKGPFLRTGGFFWQGELYFSSRLKDLIIINGKNYAPQDIEDTVENSHPLLRIGCTAVFSVTKDEFNHSPHLSRHVDMKLTKLQRKSEADSIDDGHMEQLCIVAEVKRVQVDSEMISTIKKNIQQAVFERHNLPVNTNTNLVLVHAATVPKTTSGKIKRSETKLLFLDGKFTEISGETEVTWLHRIVNLKNFVVFVVYEYLMYAVFLLLFVWNTFNMKILQTKRQALHIAGTPKRLLTSTVKKLQLKYQQSQAPPARRSPPAEKARTQQQELKREALEPVEKHLISVLQTQMQISEVDPETSFAQYGMKSVDAVEIASKLQEHYRKKIHPACFYEFYNVQKLAQFILHSDDTPISEVPKEEFVSRSLLSSDTTSRIPSSAFVLGLGTANPPHKLSQADLLHLLMELSNSITESAESLHKLKKLFNASGIQDRHLCLPPSVLAKLDTIEERNNYYVQLAPPLAAEAAQKALQDWGGDKSLITHVISVSCTGTIVPGLEYHIMERLGLDNNVTRLGLNFMGCFGGLAGLRTAQSIALADPRHRVLVVCTELCSLQVQMDDIRNDNLVADTIFGDGAAAVVVGSNPQSTERPSYEIAKSACHSIPRTEDRITWNLSNTGWKVGLHQDIGFILGQHIRGFCEALCESAKVEMNDRTHWAIHPGGKAIIELIEQKMNLAKEQTSNTWKTYLQKGNMSSATILFVLAEMKNSSKHSSQMTEPVVALAFGPGLSIEGVLLKK